MRLGFSLPTAGAWATPRNILRVAREAESLGYSSVWTFQRLLYALEPKNDYPPLPNQPWPEGMKRVLDPLATLAFVASATSRVRLGVSVLIMPYYTPVMLAKQLATIDLLSDGRLDVGLGVGWSMDEFDAVGVPYSERGRRGDEFLRCLKTIWTDEIVQFEGRYYQVPRSLVEPKPVQRPHPPITVGGYGSAAIRRAVTLGDGFNGGNLPFSRALPLVLELREAAQAAGRDLASFQIVSRGSYRVFDSPRGPDRRPLFGTLQEIRDDLQRYTEAGLTELFLEPNFTLNPEEKANPALALERTLRTMEALAPAR